MHQASEAPEEGEAEDSTTPTLKTGKKLRVRGGKRWRAKHVKQATAKAAEKSERKSTDEAEGKSPQAILSDIQALTSIAQIMSIYSSRTTSKTAVA